MPLRVFIGFDAREAVAYQVLTHSILRRASAPVTFCPIVRGHLGSVHTRERGPLESTDFSITRFLVPWLSGYDGLSIFMDCDFLCLADIHELLHYVFHDEWLRALDPRAIWVCKHDYIPKALTYSGVSAAQAMKEDGIVVGKKFGGQPQTVYRRKNWSSLMLFRNELCKALTPDYVNTASGLDLHQFAWLGDKEIGSIPLEWNHLVGEYPPNPNAKMLHYTLGGLWFGRSEDSLLWTNEYREMTGTLTFQGADVR